MESILDRVRKIAAETAANGPALRKEQEAKRAKRDARVAALYAALAPLSGLCVRWGSGYATLDVLSQYEEVAVCFCAWERYEVPNGRDEVEIRWRKTKHCATKWSFSPIKDRGCSVAWENGLQDYEEYEAALDDAAKRIGPLVTTHPAEQ